MSGKIDDVGCEQRQYIDEKIFEELINDTTVKEGIKFICEAPVGSGKTTAIKKFITNMTKSRANANASLANAIEGTISSHSSKGCDKDLKEFKFIFIVPTVNIAQQFCDNFTIKTEDPSTTIYDINPCVGDGAFKAFKQSMKEDIKITPLIVTTYSTASKCLGSMVEYFYRHKQQNKIDECFLIIDECHLLLEHSSLIETIRDFKHVGLLSATAGDISTLMVFKDYILLKPFSKVKYDRTIYIHESELRTESLLNQVALKVEELMNEAAKNRITLVKIEDKQFCKQLKEKLNYKYNVYLYNSDTKEIVIDDRGKFKAPDENKNDSFIVVSTSCIQAGQSLNDENLVSVFIQTPLDVISNVQQFIGRNRQPLSECHLFLHLVDNGKKPLTYDHGNNRYKSKYNKMRSIAWTHTSVDKWKDALVNYGTIIDETKPNEVNQIMLDGKEYTSKKALYKHHNIKSLKHIPNGYKVHERWQNKDGVKTRLYKLCRIE